MWHKKFCWKNIKKLTKTVKNKIDPLRGRYRTELNKIKDLRRPGPGTDDDYKEFSC